MAYSRFNPRVRPTAPSSKGDQKVKDISLNITGIEKTVTFEPDDRGVVAVITIRLDDSGIFKIGERVLAGKNSQPLSNGMAMLPVFIGAIMRRLLNMHLKRIGKAVDVEVES